MLSFFYTTRKNPMNTPNKLKLIKVGFDEKKVVSWCSMILLFVGMWFSKKQSQLRSDDDLFSFLDYFVYFHNTCNV